MYITHLANYKIFSRIGQLAIWVAAPLLFITLMGGEINDASRWLTVPIINASFQTSDLAKLALIMYIARLLSRKQEHIKEFKGAFLPLLLPIFVTCGLILPANFSTAALLFLTSMVLLFIGRVNIKYILALAGVGVIAFALFILVALNFDLPGRIGTWKARIENFSSEKTEGNYQSEQAKIAIANGGLIGMGPGKSEQRNFLPHPYSDFIFAIILDFHIIAEFLLVGPSRVIPISLLPTIMLLANLSRLGSLN
jgi:cell division protein FtsW